MGGNMSSQRGKTATRPAQQTAAASAGADLADEIREQQRQTWDRFAPGWMKWDALVMKMLAPVGAQMIHGLALRDGTEHLDIASGTGEPGLSIAAMIPRGRVVLTDLSGGMLAAARANAARRGLANVETFECGAKDLPFGDSSFDTITCRFGFMFFPDIAGSVAELLRVLRPGGRISAAVWAGPPGNPWATIPLTAISAEAKLPTPPPDAPGLFRCAAPGAIGGMFRGAGMREVAETDVHGFLQPASAEQYWNYATEVLAPVVAGLAAADDSARDRIRATVIGNVRTFEQNGQLRLPLHARCIIGTK
jgi:ubiquinone/menaquinone biosynthesis C-methylase UbiE